MRERDLKCDRVPDRYEVLNGVPVELTNDTLAVEVANLFHHEFLADPAMEAFGRARMAVMYHLPHPTDPYRCRRPSVAWTSFERFPEDTPISYYAIAAEMVPEFVVEVATWKDTDECLLAKAAEYLSAGVRLVWLIRPRTPSAVVLERGRPPRLVASDGELDGGTTLPGLRCRLADSIPPYE